MPIFKGLFFGKVIQGFKSWPPEIGAEEIPSRLILNKIDQLSSDELKSLDIIRMNEYN